MTNPPSPTDSAGSGYRNGPQGGSAKKLGKAERIPDIDAIDALDNPTEREAAQKLQQAVQRIKANRERRGNPARGGPGSGPSGTRRDW